MDLTFVLEDAAVFQCEYALFAFVHAVEVMADLQAGEILCRKEKENKKRKNRSAIPSIQSNAGRRTLSILILEHLIHGLELLLPLSRQLLLLLLAPLDPLQGVVCIAVGVTERRTLKLRVELAPVPHPVQQVREQVCSEGLRAPGKTWKCGRA